MQDEEIAKALFKSAANSVMKEKRQLAAEKDISIKYQVLCEQTAMVGVIK